MLPDTPGLWARPCHPSRAFQELLRHRTVYRGHGLLFFAWLSLAFGGKTTRSKQASTSQSYVLALRREKKEQQRFPCWILGSKMRNYINTECHGRREILPRSSGTAKAENHFHVLEPFTFQIQKWESRRTEWGIHTPPEVSDWASTEPLAPRLPGLCSFLNTTLILRAQHTHVNTQKSQSMCEPTDYKIW